MLLRPALLAAATLLLGGVVVTADPSLLTWPDLTARARPAANATISYGADPYQKVDVWLPVSAQRIGGKHPLVLMVHGGCWQTSIADRTLMDWIAADLRSHGIAVWNIDYRGVEVVQRLTGGRFADTSIPRLLPLRVPQDLVNGRKDAIIPWRLATGYVAQARAKGDRVTLHAVARTGHVELVAPESAAWAETRRLIFAALDLPRSRVGGDRAAADGGGLPRADRSAAGPLPHRAARGGPPPRAGEEL